MVVVPATTYSAGTHPPLAMALAMAMALVMVVTTKTAAVIALVID
jgi:hypothetical protein